MIAAKQVLVSYPWGELKFKDAETEYSWRMCVPLEPLPNPKMDPPTLCELTVSQERGFESHHLVFLKARPQHTMERW